MSYDAIIKKKTEWLTLQFYFLQEKFEESSEISLPDFFAPEKYRHDKALYLSYCLSRFYSLQEYGSGSSYLEKYGSDPSFLFLNPDSTNLKNVAPWAKYESVSESQSVIKISQN